MNQQDDCGVTMAGREQRWPPHPHRGSLDFFFDSPQSNNSPCLRVPSSPSQPTTAGLEEIAVSNFPAVASGDESMERFHGEAGDGSSAATAPSFVKVCLGGGPYPAMNPGRRNGRSLAAHRRKNANQWEEK